jgi:hypothetical protein
LSANTPRTLATNDPYAVTSDWQAPQTGVSRQPPGLDDAGVVLHGLIARRAASTGAPSYFHAMADLTGVDHYRTLSDVPPGPAQQGEDAAARAVVAHSGVSWMDVVA